MPFSKLKTTLQTFLLSKGIEIRKAPASPCKTFPFFKLAVAALQHSQGSIRFIQVGANDGVHGDPISEYVKRYRWEGILIEPQSDVFHNLVANYEGFTNLAFVNKAIHPSLESIDLYKVKGIQVQNKMPWELTISSVNPNVVARQSKRSAEELERLTVAAISLDNLIRSHHYESFDLLQIDCEGFDGEVLKSINLNLYRPKIIQFEHGHMTRAQLMDAAKYLSRSKYDYFYGGCYSDSLALSAEFSSQLH